MLVVVNTAYCKHLNVHNNKPDILFGKIIFLTVLLDEVVDITKSMARHNYRQFYNRPLCNIVMLVLNSVYYL